MVRTLLKRLEALAARLHQNSSNSSRPPSTAAPATKRQRRTQEAERRKAGAQPGHPGQQQLMEPTATVALFPTTGVCGHSDFADLMPYHTPQVIALPVIRPKVTHWQLHQGWCRSCGTLGKATMPVEHGRGYGSRITSFVGEMTGIVGASRSAVQDLCAALFGIPLSKGAIQKMVDRVSAAILPHDTAIGAVARTAPVNYIDETSWCLHGDRQWLWVMANPAVAYFQSLLH
jgi:transposase